MPTDGLPARRPDGNAEPEPLEAARLAAVPGVLGTIARERSGDYAARAQSGLEQDVRECPDDRGGKLAEHESAPSFAAALGGPGLAIIAEIKRSSPSQGAIAPLDPAVAARQYAQGGASALSVLTEPRHFDGKLSHIPLARRASGLPVLRKDFTVHPRQLQEALSVGASAVLLIVALTGSHTAAYLRYARSLGLDVLVEVHDDDELQLALEAGARIIGVNNRDLRTLEIDLGTAPRLLARARSAGFDGLLVAESGYRTADELRSLDGLADAVLVGTSLAGAGDLSAALRALLADGKGTRRETSQGD